MDKSNKQETAWSSVNVFRLHPQGPKGLTSLLSLTSFYHSVEPLQTLAECRERWNQRSLSVSGGSKSSAVKATTQGLRATEWVWSGGWGLRQEGRKWEVTEPRCDTGGGIVGGRPVQDLLWLRKWTQGGLEELMVRGVGAGIQAAVCPEDGIPRRLSCSCPADWAVSSRSTLLGMSLVCGWCQQ